MSLKVNPVIEVAVLLAGSIAMYGAAHLFDADFSRQHSVAPLVIGGHGPSQFQHNRRQMLIALDVRDEYSPQEWITLRAILSDCNQVRILCQVVVPDSSQVTEITHQLSITANVRAMQLSTLGLKGTPTAVLLDEEGQVQGLWEGNTGITEPIIDSRLRAQRDTLATLTDNPSKHSSDGMITFASERASVHEPSQSELAQALRRRTLLDVRTRDEFAAGHRQGAVNIPEDEIAPRALIELGASRALLLDCSEVVTCPLTWSELRDLGYSDVALLNYGARGASCKLNNLRDK